MLQELGDHKRQIEERCRKIEEAKAGGEAVIEWLFKIKIWYGEQELYLRTGREPSLCQSTRRVVGGNVGITEGLAS